MKRVLIVLSLVTVMLFATQAMSADREAIKNNEANGNLVVHPTLAGQDLKVKAMPIFEALQAATPEGLWVTYQWDGKEKNTYTRKTKSNLTVGSGY
jgi:opacity protein-like surface antigen